MRWMVVLFCISGMLAFSSMLSRAAWICLRIDSSSTRWTRISPRRWFTCVRLALIMFIRSSRPTDSRLRSRLYS